ncbi:MAG: RluA family pseudouridine synthase [Eubacteriaceae bacterium]|nr:RluA family pseudouridine synthase [Eubacteriaceae bacterium]
MIEISVDRDYDGMRLDRFIQKAAGLGRNTAQKLLRKGEVRINGIRSEAGTLLKEGDTVRIYGAEEKKAPAVSFDESLGGVDVLYEDEFILAVNKPAYLPTQPMKGSRDCLSERVKNHLKPVVEEYGGRFIPAPVNRLDFETSGTVLCGKTPAAARALSEMLREERIEKHYTALCSGKLEKTLRLEDWAAKDSSKNRMVIYPERREGTSRMLGIYRGIGTCREMSLVDAKLITGKTHQIRVQLANTGYPLINDYKYGNRRVNDAFREEYGVERLLLHCSEVSFSLWYAPGSIRICCELPEEMKRLVEKIGFDRNKI